jgi:hypothetical protein
MTSRRWETKVHIGVARVRNFFLPESGAKKELPNLQLLVRRCGIERTISSTEYDG